MDEGYLFFRAEPIEVGIDNDSVDIEIRIVEGPQATIDKVTIRGMIERMSMSYVENSVRDQVKNSAEVISSVHNERLWDLDFSIQKHWVLILLSILEENSRYRIYG